MRIIKKIKDRYYIQQWKKQQREIEDTFEHIWGLKSYDDLTLSECNFHTMNDIDITYNKKEKYYFIGIETIYMFKDGRNGEKKYMKTLLDKFTEWMISKGYDITQEIGLYEAFTKGNNINTHFESLEELYANFKFLVNGFVNYTNPETLDI